MKIEEIYVELKNIQLMIEKIYGNNYSRFDLLRVFNQIYSKISLILKQIKNEKKLETLDMEEQNEN